MTQAHTLTDGLYFGEGPRWHNGRLWFSDFYDHAVKSMDTAGRVQHRTPLRGSALRLGWLPDGRLLVVSMRALKVLRQEGTGFVEHADCRDWRGICANDMVVDGNGRPGRQFWLRPRRRTVPARCCFRVC